MRKNNLKNIATVLCAGSVLLAMPSCDNDHNVVEDEYELVTPADPSASPETEEVTFPTAMIGNFGGADSYLRSSFTNIVDAAQAKIIIIESGAIKDNEALLANAYSAGVLIAVFNPDGSIVSDWSERNDVFYAGPEEDESCAIYGFNNGGTYYSLLDSDIIEDDDVPLFHFCNWVNTVVGQRYRGVDLRNRDIRKRFAPQSVTHTFKIKLDEKQLVDGHWADDGLLKLSTTANVTYDIYPIHVFDGDAKGDYYAVEAEMVLDNAPLNNGNWVRRRGEEVAQICGFYLNRCDVSATLMRKSNGTISASTSHAFASGASPRPASMSDATAYDPGFVWEISATVSGGVPDSKDNYKLTAFNNWMWSNSAEAKLPGVEIKNNSNVADVDYSLLVNGLPATSDNPATLTIPEPATGDVTFKYSWIWHVGDMDANSSDRLYMQVGVNPLYQAYQWLTGGKLTIGEFENAMKDKSTFRFPLTPPNRVATCSAIIRNSAPASYYITDIKLWRNRSVEGEPDYTVPQTISTPTATGGSGVSATMLILPAGDYMIQGVRYSMENDHRVDERVIMNPLPITLTAAGTVTIDFGSDAFIVK